MKTKQKQKSHQKKEKQKKQKQKSHQKNKNKKRKTKKNKMSTFTQQYMKVAKIIGFTILLTVVEGTRLTVRVCSFVPLLLFWPLEYTFTGSVERTEYVANTIEIFGKQTMETIAKDYCEIDCKIY